MIKIRGEYIPAYHKKVIGFQQLLKEVFWLTEWEQRAKKIELEHSFESIVNSVKNKDHIIHLAFEFRNGTNKCDEETFISKLTDFLRINYS